MRTILLTGASGGLAQSLVTLLPNDRLILVGRSLDRLTEMYGELKNCHLYQLDIHDSQLMADFVATCYREFGQIDILINNAGYGIFEDFYQITDEMMKDMFEVNTFATMTFSRLVGHEMKKLGKGQIINIASMAGHIATSKSSLYSATKFAVIGFSNALRLELADDGVIVTTVNPGPFKTAFFDKADPTGNYLASVDKYLLTPEQVSKRIVAILGKKKREVNLPFALQTANFFYKLFPNLGDSLARKSFNYK